MIIVDRAGRWELHRNGSGTTSWWSITRPMAFCFIATNHVAHVGSERYVKSLWGGFKKRSATTGLMSKWSGTPWYGAR